MLTTATPVSCIDSPRTRHATPQVAGPALSDASRRALYPELHKRLDDAHNSVRVAACGALRAFVRAAGPAYCDTNR